MIVQNPTITELVKFERLSWPKELRASAKELRERKEQYGHGIFMLDDKTQVTVAPKQIPHKITGFEQMKNLPVDVYSPHLWVLNIATSRRERGKGYAKRLIQHVLEWAYTVGYKDVQTGLTCHGLKESGLSVKEYMRRGLNPAFNLFPSVSSWHEVAGYWPEDEGSLGYGIVIKVIL